LPNGPAKFLPFAARRQFAGSFLQEYTGKGAGRKQHAGKTATFEDVEASLTSNRGMLLRRITSKPTRKGMEMPCCTARVTRTHGGQTIQTFAAGALSLIGGKYKRVNMATARAEMAAKRVFP
jgi:hypothetical protein